MSQEKLTVGKLRRTLRDLPPDMPVTFGSTSYSRLPLTFVGTKTWDDDDKIVMIELCELFATTEEEKSVAEPEHSLRITVEDLLLRLKPYEDDWTVGFSCSLEGTPLEFQRMGPVLAFDLVQPRPPLGWDELEEKAHRCLQEGTILGGNGNKGGA